MYVNTPRKNKPYTYFPDINGNFYITNANVQNPGIEADYSWVYFALDASNFADGSIYVSGMFTNYTLTDDYKMDFNKNTGLYEKAILMKQGFTNFQYIRTDKKGNIDFENAVDGNYYQTENNYKAIIYYRDLGARYDRIIGVGEGNSVNISN